MKCIASAIGAVALLAAAMPMTAQVAFIAPPPRPTPDPTNPSYWFDCTPEQASEAIRRHCDRVEAPRTQDNLMCINDWIAQDHSRRRQPPPVDPIEAAHTACRGQIHRRIGETRAAREARLIASGDALRPPAVARPPAPEGETCRSETGLTEDGDRLSLRVQCRSVTER